MMSFPEGMLAALGWGLVAAAALPLGAAAGCWLRLPQRAVASIMAFGSGTLLAALSIVLMQDAYEAAGFVASAAGFLAGALAFTLVDIAIRRRGGKHRKRSGQQTGSNGLAIAAGSMLDNVPEMMVLGLGLSSGRLSVVMLSAIFISNFPEALASAAGLKRAGRSDGFILGLWGAIAAVAAASTPFGFLAFSGTAGEITGVASALAAGAILAMVADTMIPEAYEMAHDFSGLVTAVGFLLAFVLHQLQP